MAASLRSSQLLQAAGCMFEHGSDLLALDSGKPGKKIIDCRAVPQVLKQRDHWDTCSSKTQEPLSLLGSCSNAGHCDQSSIIIQYGAEFIACACRSSANRLLTALSMATLPPARSVQRRSCTREHAPGRRLHSTSTFSCRKSRYFLRLSRITFLAARGSPQPCISVTRPSSSL